MELCLFVDTWFPAEVVELVAHAPSEPGFSGYTVILINAIYDSDRINDGSFRWNNNKHAHQGLDFKARKPILDAFLHIYETVPN